jgi:hypothetical protein
MSDHKNICASARLIFGCTLAICIPAALLSQQRSEQHPAKLLDVMRVTVEGDANQALVAPATGHVRDVKCDVVVIGAGMGGVSAALAATADVHTVCMTEPTMWVGGQATSQGVSAFDDNKWIDTTGGTESYLELSRRIREYYAKARRDTSLPIGLAIKGPLSNPGGCWVGRLCFEPEPAEEILMSMLQPSLKNERLKLWVHTVPVEVERKGRMLRSVLVYDFGHNEWLRLHGKYFVEASELGELLPLSGLPFRIGAESQSETHERNAPTIADPHASQSFTYPFILAKSLSPGTANDPKPPAYDSFLPHYTFVVDYGHGQLLTYGFYEHRKGLPGSFWVYRRSVDAELFRPEDFPTDRSMINWSSNDHCDANLLSNDPLLQAHALQDAKRASAGFAWWIRHSAPRDDHNGTGYPELEVLPHAMGSEDGLSQHPYIRESRRIIPIRTIVEEDLAVDFQPGARAALYPDTVGIGWYPIDIHSCDRQDFVSQSKPYEIPLGALIDRDADNLLAVGKAIGTTHITNGAYRLHPTEWATGEAAGVTLAWSLDRKITPAKLDLDPKQLEKLQLALVRRGHPIFWYDDVAVDSTDFIDMQMAGARQWFKPDTATLHGVPESDLLGSEAATALQGIVKASALARIREKTELKWADLHSLGMDVGNRAGTVRRVEFAYWMLNR